MTEHKAMVDPDPVQARRRSAWVWVAFLVGGLAAIYLPGLDNALVFDDLRMLEQRLVWAEYDDPLELKQRWLSYQSFVWVEAVFGEGGWKQRLFNILLHLLVSLLLLALITALLRCGRERGDLPWQPQGGELAALRVGVLLYALNPVAVYAVAYLIQRSIVMATLFVVLGLIAYIRMLEQRKTVWLVAAIMCYVLAMLSKEHALMAPIVAVLIHVYAYRLKRFHGADRSGFQTVEARKGPGVSGDSFRARGLMVLVAVSGGVAAIGVLFLSSIYGNIVGVPFDQFSRLYLAELTALSPGLSHRVWLLSVMNQTTLFFYHGFLWLVPVVAWMSIDLRPPFPLAVTSFPHFLGLLVFSGMTLAALWALLWRGPRGAFLGLCILIAVTLFLTELAVVWIQDPMVLYRGYLWAIALPGIAFAVASRLAPGRIYSVGAIVLIVFVVLAGERVRSMSSGERVWDDAVVKTELFKSDSAVGRWRPYVNRGIYRMESGEMDLAAEDFRRAIELGDSRGHAYYNLGRVLVEGDEFEQALTAFNEAEQRGMAAHEPQLFLYRADVYWELQLDDEAFSDLRRVIESDVADEYKRAAQAKLQLLEFKRLGPRGPVNQSQPLGWPPR